MFTWLSKFCASRVSPAEMAAMSKALEETMIKLLEVSKTVARMERKVYRDLAAENGGETKKEGLQAMFEETKIGIQQKVDLAPEEFGPGDQLPDDFRL